MFFRKKTGMPHYFIRFVYKNTSNRMKKLTAPLSRRSFLAQGSRATLAVGIGSSLIGTAFLHACGSNRSAEGGGGSLSTGYEQTPLTYAFDALEPHIDAKTMEIHYSKHAAGYAKNLRDAMEEENVECGYKPTSRGSFNECFKLFHQNAQQ